MLNAIQSKNLIATTEEINTLGHLFWFSIGKQMNKVEDLKQNLVNSGLGEEWMPNRIRSVDAFRRATREIQTRKPTSNAKIFENYLVREIYSNDDFVQRNIVVETVDQSDKKLGYETQKGIMKLDKKNDVLIFEATDPDVIEMCKMAREKFNLYRHYYSSQHIRVMITKILNSLAPTPMRERGIIYFVPNTMTKGLTSLVNFINSLENSDAHKVPVIDSNDNRFMVSKKLSDHLKHLLNQCQNTEGLRKDQIKNLVEETNRAIKDYKQYKDLTFSETENFENQIIKLRTEVVNLVHDIHNK